MIQAIDTATLDPTTVINSQAQGSTVLNALYGDLFTLSQTGTFQPGLATGFTTNDGLVWTMTLRSGVRFSDGTTFDAAAVKAQWERVAGNIRASAWPYLKEDLVGLTVTNAATLEVRLAQPDFEFDQLVAGSSLEWIPSPSAYAAEGTSFANKPVGAGPFLLRNRIPNVETDFVRNPTYWAAGEPKLGTLVIKTISSSQQAYDTLVTGGADAAVGLAPEQIAQATSAGMRIVTWPMVGGTGWLFGTKRAPFNDITARKAVYLALNIDELNQAIEDGKGTIATSLFPQGTPFYSPQSSFPPPNRTEAQALFNQLAAEGKPVKFTISTTANQSHTYAIELQTQLQTFKNVQVGVQVVDSASYGVTLYSGNFDLAIYGVGGSDPEPALETMRSGWPIPIASMDDPVIDAALDQARQTTDLSVRQAAYARLAVELNKLYRMKWMWSGTVQEVETKKATGILPYGDASVLVQAFGLVS